MTTLTLYLYYINPIPLTHNTTHIPNHNPTTNTP